MPEVERSREYKTADSRLRAISDRLLENIDEVIRDLPGDEQRHLIMIWFGDDTFDAYADWLEEGE